MFEESEAIINKFKLIEKEHLIDYSDDIELIFVELPKFDKGLEELTNIKEQWIYFLKNAGSLEYIPKTLDKCIIHALNNANEANLTKEELEAQHKRKEFISIQKLAILKAKEDGLEEGIERGMKKGIELGMEQGVINSAIKMITKFKLSIEEVAKELNISIDELEKHLDRP